MKQLRLLLAISLLAGLLLCSGVAYADEGDADLTVGIGVVGDDVEVNMGIDANNVEVNMGINSGNADIYMNGQNINQPTVIHRGGGDSCDNGPSFQQVYSAIAKRLEPVYSWMEDRDGAIGLTIDGLAKVILTINGQDSALDKQSSRLDEQEKEIAALRNSVDSKTLSLENQLALSRQHTEDIRTVYNRNMVILFSLIGALIISNIVIAVKIRQK
ncbi:unnamed protein product [marine sediment metagenome]|uniref:Uncharacterized protein n=1 Tax=marine sediment metagenome TaxID=412755 RepID=X1L2Y9_9ZZZZ